MDYRQIIAGAIIGAILGLAGTAFLFQGRISKLEATIDQIKIDKSHRGNKQDANSSKKDNGRYSYEQKQELKYTHIIYVSKPGFINMRQRPLTREELDRSLIDVDYGDKLNEATLIGRLNNGHKIQLFSEDQSWLYSGKGVRSTLDPC